MQCLLGTINKFLSAPLWRVTEEEGHILDMTNIDAKVDDLLITEEGNEEHIQFAKGEITCFDEKYVTEDNIYNAIVLTVHMKIYLFQCYGIHYWLYGTHLTA